jgi:hypothetical protein
MSLIVVGAEKNFAALRPRLFSGSVSSKAAGQVSAAIQAANPHADLKALAPGTVLMIPDDVPHVAVHGGISIDDISKKTVTSVVADGQETITQLTADALAAAKAAATERRALAKSLGSAELRAAASRDKAAAAGIQAAQDALAAADDAAKARSDALARARSEWSAELAALQETLPTG